MIDDLVPPPDLLRGPDVPNGGGEVGQAGDDLAHGRDAPGTGLLVREAEVLELSGLGLQLPEEA